MAPRFDRRIEVSYGTVDVLSPRIRRVVADNPGPFTFLGSGTYLVGRGEVAVIDPGPADERHTAALLAATAGETITHILITHTHADHSPGAAALVAATGARTYGFGPHPADDRVEAVFEEPAKAGAAGADERGEGDAGGDKREHFDAEFVPHVATNTGDVIAGTGWTVEAIHTPGHLSNHSCFGLLEERTLFSGDHVMAWSTTVISPPGGDLRAYLRSCDALLDGGWARYWPTHGPAVQDPDTYVRALVAHRHERTAQVIERLRTAPATIPEIVAACYPGLDEKLVRAAGRSVLAHLHALRDDGTVRVEIDAGRRDGSGDTGHTSTGSAVAPKADAEVWALV